MDARSREFDVSHVGAINWIASDCLARDREQSHRLHEPDHLVNTIDPISGRDIVKKKGRPSIVDGNLTIYFESEETRKAFEDLPTDHPFRLQDNPNDDGEAEG